MFPKQAKFPKIGNSILFLPHKKTETLTQTRIFKMSELYILSKSKQWIQGKETKKMLIIILLALISRIVYFIFEKQNPLFLFPVIDENEYLSTAFTIIEKNGLFPFHFWHPPAYSFFLAFWLWLGFGMKGIIILQFLMGILTVAFLYFALKKINTNIAFIACLIWSVYPVELFIESKFLSENLFMFLIVLLFYLSLEMKSKKLKTIFLPLLAGLLIITKTQFFIFVILYLVFMAIRRLMNWKEMLFYFALSMVFPLAVSLHNAAKTEGKFVFVSSNGPVNFYIGNSANLDESLNIRPWTWKDDFFPSLYDEAGIKFFKTETEESNETYPYKISNFLIKKTFNDNTNPGVFLNNLAIKIFITLHAHETPRNYDLYIIKQFNPILNFLVHSKPLAFPLVFFFFSALLFMIIRWKSLLRQQYGLLMILIILATLIPSILFFNAFRYRLAAIPFLIFLSIWFYKEYWKNITYQAIHAVLILLFGSSLTSVLLIQKIPNFETYDLIGDGFLDKKEFKKAEKYYLLALESAREEKISDKQLSNTYTGLAFIAEETGNKDLADFAIQKAVDSDTAKATNFYNQASIKFRRGNYAGAIEDYTKAIEIKDENDGVTALAYYGRALAKIRIPDYQGALEDLNQSIQLNPKHAESWANRGIILGQAGNTKEAISDLNKAIQLKPDYDLAYQNRAIAYFTLNNINQAISDLNLAIEINPQNSEAIYLRGMTNIQQGNKEKGCKDLETSAKLGLELAAEKAKIYCK